MIDSTDSCCSSGGSPVSSQQGGFRRLVGGSPSLPVAAAMRS
jgi:hypothetical protein